MLAKYTERYSSYGPTFLRVGLGLVFIFMGLSKIENPMGFINGFATTSGIPLPIVLGWLPVILEPIGGLFLVLGIGTRWLAGYFTLEMLVTAFYVKARRGTPFIVAGGQPGVGWELDFLLLLGALALLVLGSGRLSIERDVLHREL